MLGDPFVAWGEEVAARENLEMEMDMEEPAWLENLKNAVVKFLVFNHDFEMEEAETAVAEAYKADTSGIMANTSGMWNENSSAEDLATYLASDDEDD